MIKNTGIVLVLIVLLVLSWLAGYFLAPSTLIVGTMVLIIADGAIWFGGSWDEMEWLIPFACTLFILALAGLMWGTYYVTTGQTWIGDFLRGPHAFKFLR